MFKKNKLFLFLSLFINIGLLLSLYIFSGDCETVPKDIEPSLSVVSPSINETLFYREPFTEGDIDRLKSFIDYGSIFLVDASGEVFIDYNSFVKMTPASTLKIITALSALHYLGKDFRFKTVFSLDKDNNLYIKGYGDPIITSKELSYIVRYLKESKGLSRINSIFVDGGYFPEFVMVPGNENTYESYDSKNGALSVNFNTISLRRRGRRVIKLSSGEKETPYVDFARSIFNKARREDYRVVNKREFRISIKNYKDSLLYFGYLFKSFCNKFGIEVSGGVSVKELPEGSTDFYVHKSRQSLEHIVNSLMLFSNNYIANQLLIMMGVTVMGGGPSLDKGLMVLNDFARDSLGIGGIRLSEGAGLSYGNKVNARQMAKVLEHFKPYKHLLKPLGDNVYVKSGGLKSVSSYVGYIDSERYGELRFAILLNQSTDNKRRVLNILRDILL